MPRYSPRAFWSFVRRGVMDWKQTASLFPSQRYLVRAMVEAGDVDDAQCVVEIGPGVGVVTHELLDRIPESCSLFSVEIENDFCDILEAEVSDPRFHLVRGSAEFIRPTLDKHRVIRADTVISSIGLSVVPPDIRDAIMEEVKSVLPKGRPYVQFGYVHTAMIPYRGNAFDYEVFLKRHFGNVTKKVVPLNVPPAWVYQSIR